MRRRRIWLPLLLALAALLACGAWWFRWIGLGEFALLLVPLTLMFAVESLRYIAQRFWAGYRRRD